MKSGVFEQLLAEAEAADAHECCGLLLGDSNAITAIRPTANIHPQPRTRFEIDPQALIDAYRAERGGGPSILGYYHSHPAGPPEPSATDQALAAPDNKVWAIIGREADGGWTVGFWRSGEGGFVPLPSETLTG